MRILLVEDYAPLARSVAQGLREAGYAVDAVMDGKAALSHAESAEYDVIVLDLNLPEVDGLTVLRLLRAKGNRAAVLILTARDGVPDHVAGLDAGADDYLVKPFALDELLARVRTVVRRRYDLKETVIKVADLEVDVTARLVKRKGVVTALSAREYGLLEYLATRQGQIVTRAEIWEHVYDFTFRPGTSNVVDVYIGYLRKKIDQDGDTKLIHTYRGQGYMLGVPA